MEWTFPGSNCRPRDDMNEHSETGAGPGGGGGECAYDPLPATTHELHFTFS